MPLKVTGELKGEKRIERQLKTLENIQRPLDRAMSAYLQDVEEAATPYPAASSANSPPGDGYKWYVRNLGFRTVTGKSYRVSEQLSKRWKFFTRLSGSGVQGVIENNASYAGLVQGKKQLSYHARRGWKRIDKEIDQSIKKLTVLIKKEIKRDMR